MTKENEPTRGYLHDILEQPAALRATLAGLERGLELGDLPGRLAGGDFDQVVLTGMGSSYHGLYPLYYQLAQHGLPAVMIETSELIHHAPRLVGPRALIVAVSQSGRSAETVRLMDLAAARGAPVLGVTNTAGSPLDTGSAARILTAAGEEATVSCKTYQCALLALGWLGDALTGADTAAAQHEAQALAGMVQAYLERLPQHVDQLEKTLRGVEHLFLAGRGASLAVCGTGALICKESAHVHAEGMSAAALRHGPLEMLGPGCFGLVFAGDAATHALNFKLYEELLAIGIPAGWVDSGPDSDSPFTLPAAPARLRPILEILPVEMMTLALARLRGRTAGVFERGAKVTATE